jgi:hypothetical protein
MGPGVALVRWRLRWVRHAVGRRVGWRAVLVHVGTGVERRHVPVWTVGVGGRRRNGVWRGRWDAVTTIRRLGSACDARLRLRMWLRPVVAGVSLYRVTKAKGVQRVVIRRRWGPAIRISLGVTVAAVVEGRGNGRRGVGAGSGRAGRAVERRRVVRRAVLVRMLRLKRRARPIRRRHSQSF